MARKEILGLIDEEEWESWRADLEETRERMLTHALKFR